MLRLVKFPPLTIQVDRAFQRQEGVSRVNLASFFYASLMTKFRLTNKQVVCFLTPVFSGDITFYNEIVIVMTVHCWGLTSDRIGRRWTWIIGALLISLGTILYPFATSWTMLVCFRVIFALGASASSAMLVAVLADYVQPQSVGKAAGMMGLCTGLGAIIAVFLLVPIAKWTAPLFGNGTVLHNNGTDYTSCTEESFELAAGRTMYGAAALFGVLSSLVFFFGLKPGPSLRKTIPLRRVLMDGLRSARNPVMLMAYMAGFAARGDTIIISVFLSLWVYQSALDGGGSDSGVTPCDAVTRAGIVSGVVQTAALVAGPFIGLCADRFNRVFVFALAALTGCVGYALMATTHDVLSPGIYLSAVLVGVGEIGLVVTSAMLVAQEAKPENRGVCSGFWGLLGSVGIMFATKLGGYLYDKWWPGAPFAIFSIINGVCVLFSLGVWTIKLRCPFKNILSDYGTSKPTGGEQGWERIQDDEAKNNTPGI